MINKSYADYSWEQAAALLAIDSPSGFTHKAATWVKEAFENLGYSDEITTKGGVLVDLGGENAADGLLLAAHADTLGAMVAEVKGNGRLRLTPLGGMRAENAECECARVYTRDGNIFEGTFQIANPSVHVNSDYADTKRTFDSALITRIPWASSRTTRTMPSTDCWTLEYSGTPIREML